jgi:amino acid adenylation domain-containing protein
MRRAAPKNEFIAFRREEIEQSIPERFEQQVRRYSDRVAVKSRRYRLTYAELNRWANGVAQQVLERRGDASEPVALLFEHDAPMVAAILGALKAGKIYVTLDPTFPQGRLARMLENAEPGLVVTDERMAPMARRIAGDAGRVLIVDPPGAAAPAANPGRAIAPDAMAYIFYTSGSTGQPKGVVETHRNLLYYTRHYTNPCHFSKDDRLSLLQSCAFAGSVTPLFGALLNGGAVHPLDLKKEGVGRLAEWLLEDEITVCILGASVFRQFAGGLTGRETFPKLRMVYLGSEPLYRRVVELYKRHFAPDCILVNSLGTTEMKNFRKLFMDKSTEISGDLVPVGHEVEEAEVLLLDERGRSVGPGEVGEIAVRSRYMSPGYWRDPELTKAKFLPDPGGGPERIYRTGDLGRMVDGDCLVLLGRKDFQVKVRGYRIELPEIEGALLGLDVVREAVVVARDEGEEQRLIAYVVPAGSSASTAGDLRRRLEPTLPAYMIPSVFVMLEALPRGPTGKVDRQALPLPGRTRPEQGIPFEGPRTPLEARLAKIWADVLDLERVGIHDPFLDLGGDSLRATRLTARVFEAFGQSVSPAAVFEAPTVARMAVAVLDGLTRTMTPDARERLLSEVEPPRVEGAISPEAGEPGTP